MFVSIHAPRTGRDYQSAPQKRFHRSFNPRAPHGARLNSTEEPVRFRRFQSTRPARGATHGDPLTVVEIGGGFNPRAPHGARRKLSREYVLSRAFQSTRPARGATRTGMATRALPNRFNPRAPHGARP